MTDQLLDYKRLAQSWYDAAVEAQRQYTIQKLKDRPMTTPKTAPKTAREELRGDHIKQVVDRFLCYKLPENFAPDGGVTFKRFGNEGAPHQYKHEPMGTNLLDATQADAMIRHLLEGFTLIPTDPASVEAMVERGAKKLCALEIPEVPNEATVATPYYKDRALAVLTAALKASEPK
jgi:hypothetical protein